MFQWNVSHSHSRFPKIITSSAEFVEVARGLVETYGKCFRLWLGPELHTVFMDPKDVEVCSDIIIRVFLN